MVIEKTVDNMELIENHSSNESRVQSIDNLQADNCNRKPSEHANLYKANKLSISQQMRREKLLLEMKQRRGQAVDEMRGLSDLFNSDNEPEPMEVVNKTKIHRKMERKKYQNQLMLSEWFTEIPCDLESNWLVKLCPVGARNLVVASKRSTKAYNKQGGFQCEFQSVLPGGNTTTTNTHTFTVVDCIYDSKNQCFYILDVIAWRNCSFQLSDTDLRSFWLKSKFEEIPELKEKASLNVYPFYPIVGFPAELSLIEDTLSRPCMIDGHDVVLDGILFYHRKTHYIKSYTPLVGWLKPFMIPEMLHVPIHEYFMMKRPENYTTLRDFLSCKVTGRKKNVESNENMKMEM